MSRKVLLTDDAARDLEVWYATAHVSDGDEMATYMLDRIQDVMQSLAVEPGVISLASSTTPAIRHEPIPELRQLGLLAERQHVTDDGLRVVFRESDERVVVVLIAPVGRTFQSLLERRLLDG